MKLLFVHDHPFYREENGEVYSGGSFPSKLWFNYLINFDQLWVFGRRTSSLQSKNTLSSGDSGVSFYLTESYTSALTLLRNYRRIQEELRILIENVDVVLIRLPSVLGIIAGKEAFKLNKPIWVEQVGNAKEALESHGSLLGRFVAPILENFNQKAIKNADFVTYVTNNKLQLDYPAQKHAITVTLSNVIIKRILEESELQNNRFYSSIFKIGLVGGFDARYKGQDLLLKAISRLPTNIIQTIELFFVGKGEFNWVLEQAKALGLGSNIKYIGALEAGDKINAMLSGLSLYVQPSLTEGMPRATIEAMAMGCPVIGSDAGGISDIVSSNFVHRKGDFTKLSQDILQLIKNRDLLYKESIESLKKSADYHIDVLTERRRNFYTLMNKSL